MGGVDIGRAFDPTLGTDIRNCCYWLGRLGISSHWLPVQQVQQQIFIGRLSVHSISRPNTVSYCPNLGQPPATIRLFAANASAGIDLQLHPPETSSQKSLGVGWLRRRAFFPAGCHSRVTIEYRRRSPGRYLPSHSMGNILFLTENPAVVQQLISTRI